MTTTADILRDARALIDSPENWTKDCEARTEDGYETWYGDGHAVCWGAFGALVKAGDNQPALTGAAEALHTVVGGRIDEWNDAPERTNAEVLAAFDRAIDLAEQAEKGG